MALSVTQIKKDLFLHKAAHLYITPWVNNAGVLMPGENTWDVADIVADTTSIEQADPETQTKDWEFGDTPLMSSSTSGEITFAATCIDMSLAIMDKIFQWDTDAETMPSSGTSTTTYAAAPNTYKDTYATIVVTFEDQNAPCVLLPKVLLSSKATVGTLRTDTGAAELSGKAMAAYFKYGDTMTQISSPYVFLKPIDATSISISNDSSASNLKTIGVVQVDTGREVYLSAQ